MTRSQARKLKPGDHVSWPNARVRGTVTKVTFDQVEIAWVDDVTGSIHVGDMIDIERIGSAGCTTEP